MEMIGKHKITGVWLLLVIFTLPFVLRPIHIHHEKELANHCTEHSEHEHHCDTCLLCQSFFSVFVSTDAIEFTLLSVTADHLLPVYPESGYPVIIYTLTSRGPPCA